MNPPSLFRVFYLGVLVVLVACLLALLIITPADAIRQALNNDQLYNVFVIGGCYVLTGILAVIIYISRRWTQKTVLASIPKTWIPIEEDDVNKKVRKMIVTSLTRSAVIAWDSRPRIDSTSATIASDLDTQDHVVRLPSVEASRRKEHAVLHKQRTETDKDEEMISIPPEEPVWGTIMHDGWSSPTSPDLPNLQYIAVIQELPHLIEAKAVSLAPLEPDSSSSSPGPDIRAVGLLQRPPSMGLRDYVSHLININTIPNPTIASKFLNAYEYARFSSQPLTETQFRALMNDFAELLRSMQALSPAILVSLDIDAVESDIDDDNSSLTPVTPRSRSLVSSHTSSSRSGSEGTVRTAPSRHLGTSATSTTRRFPEFTTAPATPRSRRQVVSRTASSNTFAQSRRPYNGDSSSSTSLSSSQGSVIRLSATNGPGASPYTLTVPGLR